MGSLKVLSAASAIVLTVTVGRSAHAEPYRLRADVFAQAPDPSGFVMLQATAEARSAILFDAEALVWTGVGVGEDEEAQAQGEAVVAAVRIRDPKRGLGLRFGRLLYSGGAIRPLHFDGAVASARAPTNSQLEAFVGLPVEAGWEGRSYDFLAGGRFTQEIEKAATVGISYWQERDEGAVARSEVGAEATLIPWKRLALSSIAAIDVHRVGLAELRFAALLHDETNRLELFGVQRSPSLMLPATSLFAALGSHEANQLGLTGFYRVAPRLDLSATATVDRVGERPGATQTLRAELRLDGEGRGAIGLEARRVSMPDASWTGGRAWLRLPIVSTLAANAEVEVAVPDEPGQRGTVWPWFLTGLRWVPLRFLETAAAFETSSTPLYDFQVGGLVRVSGTWSAP